MLVCFPSRNCYLPGIYFKISTKYTKLDTEIFRIGIAVFSCPFVIHCSGPLSHVAPMNEAVSSYTAVVEDGLRTLSGVPYVAKEYQFVVSCPQMPVDLMSHLQGSVRDVMIRDPCVPV